MPSQPSFARAPWRSRENFFLSSSSRQYSSGNLEHILEMASRTVRCESVQSGLSFCRNSVALLWTHLVDAGLTLDAENERKSVNRECPPFRPCLGFKYAFETFSS